MSSQIKGGKKNVATRPSGPKSKNDDPGSCVTNLITPMTFLIDQLANFSKNNS